MFRLDFKQKLQFLQGVDSVVTAVFYICVKKTSQKTSDKQDFAVASSAGTGYFYFLFFLLVQS